MLWGEFDTEVATIRALLDEVPAGLPVMEAVRQAVLAANHYRAADVPELRARMALIGSVPALMASAAVHYDAWERAISDFVARRTGQPADSLYPLAVGRATLAACRAGYDRWVGARRCRSHRVPRCRPARARRRLRRRRPHRGAPRRGPHRHGSPLPSLSQEIPRWQARRDWFETVAEAQRRAKRRLPRSVYLAVVAGAEAGVTMHDNVRAFSELGFRPHVAGLPAERQLATTVMGQEVSLPVLHLPHRGAGRPSRR